MSERLLEHLFDSPVKVKLLKLFVHNPDTPFPLDEIRRRTQAIGRPMLRELAKLLAIGFIRVRPVLIRKKGVRSAGRRVKAYETDPEFALSGELKSLVTKPSPASRERIVERLKAVGRIRYVLLAGIFIGSETSRADLLVVGDSISDARLRNFIRDLEAEVGKELTCVALTTKEFQYRHRMFDRFVRDMIDYPHDVLVNKLKVLA